MMRNMRLQRLILPIPGLLAHGGLAAKYAIQWLKISTQDSLAQDFYPRLTGTFSLRLLLAQDCRGQSSQFQTYWHMVVWLLKTGITFTCTSFLPKTHCHIFIFTHIYFFCHIFKTFTGTRCRGQSSLPQTYWHMMVWLLNMLFTGTRLLPKTSWSIC
jgi:hypothetical protein